jgi:hypothetical protein
VKSAVSSSAFLRCKSKVSANVTLGVAKGRSRVVAEAEKPAEKFDRWWPGVLADSEELILRDVLGEMAVVGVLNSKVFEEDVAAAKDEE